MSEEVILRFNDVSFEYLEKTPLLDEVNFCVRKGAKFTLMGQNGAGKSTIFSLIKGELKPKSGNISTANGSTIGAALQVIERNDFPLTVEEYFAKAFEIVPRDLKSQINKVLKVVNLIVPMEKVIGELSGGQQSRLLLAIALIQDPDILLLDEPTNNLDPAGIKHLIEFLKIYDKTVLVISHDANFLNSFTDGIIYLDAFTKKLEMYVGNYYAVVKEISNRIEREQQKNAQLEKRIKDRKEKVNFFANKGGKMRRLAKKLADETEELEENKVDVRRDDKMIREFKIPAQNVSSIDVVVIKSVKIIHDHQPVIKEVDKIVKKRTRLLISGPNGIGKSTLLKSLVANKDADAKIADDVRVGYYSQNFDTLNFEDTVFESLTSAKADGIDIQEMRSIAAGFIITGNLMGHKVSHLSEGQKGLLSFARLVLMQPGLLILDEPTNHINFRHIPIIAKAINEYEGAIILISHMPEFIREINMDEFLDLEKIK